DVINVDNDPGRIEMLEAGEVPFYEPGLHSLLREMRQEERLRFSTSVEEAVDSSEIVFLCVPTPARENGSADLSYVEDVSRRIARSLTDYRVIVEKSTVPARTGERVARTLRLHSKPGSEFDVVSFPEFSREGSGIRDFLHPDRIVLGVESPRAEAMMRELLAPIDAPTVITNVQSAELIKHASNSFLAMKISYINAVANICEEVGADISKVAEGMGLDRRIGLEFLDAGIGYGGSCFPKDVAAFIALADTAGYDFGLLKEVRAINYDRKLRLIAKLREALWVLRGKTIAVLGLAFKPDTDDMREAPALDIIDVLVGEGANVKVYDPKAMPNARRILGDQVVYSANPYEAARGADALVILTEWPDFKRLNMKLIKSCLTVPIVVDGRNALDGAKLRDMGFEYYGMGV
ncbi:MAG: UDP-glucose/GDP-mannose dehydrogenase family protein, partial [Chloroflexi bacterium]|nr:UDP-glucose/GDP-mannose dehydrogenase family protein [Chloroflexota bacterium]